MSLIRRFKKNATRVGVIQFVAAVIFLYLSLGLFYRQIIQYESFNRRERQQCTRRIIIPAVRGNIYDRNGNLLVGNRPVFSLELYLSELKSRFREEFIKRVKYHADRDENFDRKVLYTKVRESIVNDILSPIGNLLGKDLFISGKQIDRHLFQRSLLPITLVGELTLEEYDKLINFLPANSSVQIQASSTRIYPNGQLACHVLGYTVLEDNAEKYDDHIHTFSIRQQKGKSGIEMTADDILRGVNGAETWLVLPSGEKRSLEGKIDIKNGQDVILSIDSELQREAEDALRWYTGAVIVMDVRSKEVLVLANSPSYDPNMLYPSISSKVFNEINEQSGWFNQAIQGLFPPGSIFKILSAISFFRANDFDPEEKLICEGTYNNSGRILKCHRHTSGNDIDLHLAIAESCNTYMFERAAKYGANVIADEARNYFLDRPTGIELPFETHGMVVPDAKWKIKRGLGGWSRGDTLNLSIGQGYLLTTPLSICCFTSSFAKNRQRTVPTIFHHDQLAIDAGNGSFIPRDEYFYLLDSMIDCVENFTGRAAKIDGVKVAGKTGSAQFKEKGKKRNIAWFTCFAPAYDPEIAVTVMLRESRDGQNYYGGKNAAPIARKILQKYFTLRAERD